MRALCPALGRGWHLALPTGRTEKEKNEGGLKDRQGESKRVSERERESEREVSIVLLLCEEKQALAAAGAEHGGVGISRFIICLIPAVFVKHVVQSSCRSCMLGNQSLCVPLACADWNAGDVCSESFG